MFDSDSGDITNMSDSDFDLDECMSNGEREILSKFDRLIFDLDWYHLRLRGQHPISLKLAILANEYRRGRA